MITIIDTCAPPPHTHREFGAKVMNVKLLMKALPTMFEHSDKNVRAEVTVAAYTSI